APPAYRDRVHLTACEAEQAIRGYVIGNVATSIFAAVVVLVALTLMRVPASLLLAVLAGVFDFVPVLGFILSSLPAVLLALSRGPVIALGGAARVGGCRRAPCARGRAPPCAPAPILSRTTTSAPRSTAIGCACRTWRSSSP